MMKHTGYLIALAIAIFQTSGAATGRGSGDIHFEVWSTQSFSDPFCDEDPIDVFLRLDETGYVTIYQINPWGGLEIVYPQAHHHWRPLRGGRTYHLLDLADDIYLQYSGANGYAYIGIIVTRNPVHLVPWIEQTLCSRGLVIGRYRHDRVELDIEAIVRESESEIRVRLGRGYNPSFALIPFYVRPRTLLSQPSRPGPPKSPRFYFEGRYQVVTPGPPPNHPRSRYEMPTPPVRALKKRPSTPGIFRLPPFRRGVIDTKMVPPGGQRKIEAPAAPRRTGYRDKSPAKRETIKRTRPAKRESPKKSSTKRSRKRSSRK